MRSPATSRRHFLRTTSALTAGGLASLPLSSRADSSIDIAEKLELGVKPVLDACGAVVIDTQHQIYVAFDGLQTTNGSARFGTTWIRLTGYLTHRSANESRDLTSGQLDTEQLEPCEIFKVSNSSWANSASGNGSINHYVFTFLGADTLLSGGVHLECLAEDLSVEFHARSAGQTLDYNMLERWLKARDARVARNQANWLARRNGSA